MSWIQNRTKGTYLFLCTKSDPAKTKITLTHEVGVNAVLGPNHCRLVADTRFQKNKRLYVVVVSKHNPGGKPAAWVSQEIGPGQFWVFDGEKFTETKCRPGDCHIAHGM